MSQLRAALVGFGVMGRNHARVLSSLEGVHLAAIVEPGGTETLSVPGVDIVTDVESLADQAIDYVVVASPTASHADIAEICVSQRMHALIEKPLTTDPVTAHGIARRFADAGLIGAVGHIERYNPALQQAKKRLAMGQLGDVYQIITRRQGPFPGRISDVGVILDLASHDIDLTAWVAGSPYSSVFARTAHRSGREHEDLLLAACSLQNGIMTNHIVNWMSPMKERVTVITGERGALVADTLSAELTFYENGVVRTEWSDLARFKGATEGDAIRYAFPKPEPLRVEHESFRDAVLGKSADIVTLDQGASTVAVAAALARSAESKQAVDLS